MSEHDTYSWHEALDRAGTLARSVSNQLGDHPVVMSDPTLMDHAMRAENALYDLYQAISDRAPHMKPPAATTDAKGGEG